MLQHKTGILSALGAIGVVAALTALTPRIAAQNAPHVIVTATDERWQAVAPGRVESRFGEIRIAAPMAGLISEVLVNPNDTVFAGEALTRFDEAEARARLESARTQIAVRKGVRDKDEVSGRAADRRKAEDAVADARDMAIVARAAVDKTAVARRSGAASDAELDAARAVFARAQDHLAETRATLRKLEADPGTPLPTQLEGQLSVARAEFVAAEEQLKRLIIRSPIDATVLQVNAKVGEFAGSGTTQPLVTLGDISTLRVRAEVDEHDLAAIKIGQRAVVRTDAFRSRDFVGTVASVALIVEQGRLSGPGQRNPSYVNVAEVLVDLAEPGPLVVGMKADVYFRGSGPEISAK